MKQFKQFIIMLTLGLLVLSSSTSASFERPLEPVVVNGSSLADFMSRPIDGLRVYIYSSADDAWNAVPFQVDEFVWPDAPTGEKQVVWQGDGLLTAYDELVFMAKDVGDQAPDNAAWPDDVESKRNTRYEILVTDPVTLESAFAYVYYSTTLAFNETSYIAYNSDHITTETYGIGHDTDDANGLPDSLAIAGNDIDFLDSWRIRAYIRKIVVEADLGTGKLDFEGSNIYFSEDMDETTIRLNWERIIWVDAKAEAFHLVDSLKIKEGQVRILREHTLAIRFWVEGVTEDTSKIPILTKYYRDQVQFRPAFSLDLGEAVKEIDAGYISFAIGLTEDSFGMRFYGNDLKNSSGAQDSLIDKNPTNTIFTRDITQDDWPGQHWFGYSGLTFSKVKNASFFEILDLNGPRISPGNPRLFYYDYSQGDFDPGGMYGESGLRIYDWSKPPATEFEIDALVRYYYFTENHSRSEFQQLFEKYRQSSTILLVEHEYLDTIPPGRITDLIVTDRTDTTMTITWTASGDDGDSGGPAESYIIRYSDVEPVDPPGTYDWNWWSNVAMTLPNPPAPAEPGVEQSVTVEGLSEATTYYFRMNVVDHGGNDSGLSNVASLWTTPVELVSFVADVDQQNNVQLEWSTASESNNLGFAVERKLATEEVWQEVAFVNGAGTASEEQAYVFVDVPGRAGDWNYRLKQVDTDGAFEYSQSIQVTIAAPQVFALEQNYPNPFNPATTISFQVPESAEGRIVLVVYDMLGRQVRSLMDKQAEPGYYSIQWDGLDDEGKIASSGVYLYRLKAGEFTATKKMIKLQ